MQIAYLIWDDWNQEHIVDHNVDPQEVEEMCFGERPLYRRGRGEEEMKKQKSRTPEFKSAADMAAFWDTHDSTDYWDEFEDVEVHIAAHEDRCPRCGTQMSLRRFDILPRQVEVRTR